MSVKYKIQQTVKRNSNNWHLQVNKQKKEEIILHLSGIGAS